MAERETMRANVLRGVEKFGIEEVPRPKARVGEAVIRITLTTICGTDLHIEISSQTGSGVQFAIC